MLGKPSIASNQQNKTNSTDDQIQLTDLPDEILLMINDRLPGKDSVYSASVNRYLHGLFQSEIGKKEAKEAAACAIYPTAENVEKLQALLKACPPLLFHRVKVKNRHGMVIKGTVYQIALHEGDNELIDDVIKPAFERLHNGLETMEAQRQAQLPEGWQEAEEKVCASACDAIDKVFTAFKNASNLNDVTQLPQYPYTITINNQAVNETLSAFREAIDALYKATDKVIESGRDPSIRLLERVIDRYIENYNSLGGYDTPRNNALMQKVYGYCQRSAPINFMQAFTQGIYYIVENNEKLNRTLEYRNWPGLFILPLDSDPQARLGYEHFAGAVRAWPASSCGCELRLQIFYPSKTAAVLQAYHATTEKALRNNVV